MRTLVDESGKVRSVHGTSFVALARAAFLRGTGSLMFPLVLITSLLIIFWFSLLAGLLPWSETLAELVIQNPSLIKLLSAATAFLYASLFFWPRDGSRVVGAWSDYVGLAFATIFLQYVLRYSSSVLHVDGSSLAPTVRLGVDFTIYVLSGLSNLFFLAAAGVLLNRSEQHQTNLVATNTGVIKGHLPSLRNALAKFYFSLPKWAWVCALLSPLSILGERGSFVWARFPDAIFSAYCLSSFGYATAINFNVRRRKFLAVLALLVTLIYAGGQLVYATNPVIAYSAAVRHSSAWIGLPIADKVDDKFMKISANTGRYMSAREFLDSATYALTLPMKFALFVPAFLLYLLSIIPINDFRTTLFETASRRKDYLSADGIVSAIGQTLGADSVSLFIRLPGSHGGEGAREERALPLTWNSVSSHSKKGEEPFPIKEDFLLSRVMNERGAEIFVTSENGKPSNNKTKPSAFTPESVLIVPVRFQGGIIAALRAEIRGYGTFNHTTLQKLRLMADLLAPTVHDFRSLAAVDQIGLRFTRAMVDHISESLEKSTARIAEILHDVLAPVATGLFVEMGFLRITHIHAPDGRMRALLENAAGTPDIELDFHMKACPNLRIERSEMIAHRDEQGRNHSMLGKVVLAIEGERDKFSSPTLAAHYFNRKAVASLASDGVLDLARTSFGTIIKDFGVELNKETLSREDWFAAIVRALQKAGLAWVVASKNNKDTGDDQAMSLVPAFGEEERAMLMAQHMRSINAGDPEFNTPHIVRLDLPRSKHQLWLGITRVGFGPELGFMSPWKMFLADLAEVADIALDSVDRRHESEIEKIKAAQYEGMMTIAITTGTLMHQLVNMVKDQLFATESLEESLEDNAIKLGATDVRLLRAMKRSAQQMWELTEAFKSVTKMEERKPCLLADAAEQAMKLFRVSLMQRKIETQIDVPPGFAADVPFHVAAFALANLIGNAKEAIRSNGTIVIEAEATDKFILCHVTNNGPPINPDVRASLFQLGRTSKPGHNGWGLYFVARSLQENGGSIWLDRSSSTTRFTVRLPRAEDTFAIQSGS